jgi:hypothetical protein
VTSALRLLWSPQRHRRRIAGRLGDVGECRTVRQRQNQAEVEQAQLTAIVGQADFITVLDEPYQNGKVIWASSAKSDIEEFQEAAIVRVSRDGGHCLCLGYPAIRLYRRQVEILRITSFDWKTIRWQTTAGPVWHDDVALENPTRWRRWFDSRRIPPSAGHQLHPLC